MERKALPLGPARLWNSVQYIFTGYMELPWRIVFWVLFFGVILFPLLYWLTQALGPTEGHLSWEGVLTYIIFSLRTAVTMAFNDLQPVGLAGKILTAVQGSLGVVFFALFGYSFAKRIARD